MQKNAYHVFCLGRDGYIHGPLISTRAIKLTLAYIMARSSLQLGTKWQGIV